MIHECLKAVAGEQYKASDSYKDDIDVKVGEIEKKKTTRTCPNCATEMPKQKHVCISQACRVNLKAAESRLIGEDILGIALIELVQHPSTFKETEVVLTVEDLPELEEVVTKVATPRKEAKVE